MNIAQALTLDSTLSVWESELSLLAEFASRSHKIVEVGSFRGRSARVLGDNTPGKVICVDPWDGLITYKGPTKELNAYNNEFLDFKRNLEDLIKNGKVDYFRGNFRDFYTPCADFIFIDAIHEYDSVKEDITHALTMMQGGILAGHDYADYWPGVIKAVDELLPNRKVKDTIWYVEL